MNKPSFLLPMALVSPIAFIGPVGISVFETAVIGSGLLHILQRQTLPRTPIAFAYLFLLVVGYSIAVANGYLNFGLSVGIGDLKVGYWCTLTITGLIVGYFNSETIEEIGASRFFRLIVTTLCLFILSYPFLSPQIKFAVMSTYYSPNGIVDPSARIDSIRFPGTGINANIFAFMLVMVFAVSLTSALSKRTTFFYPVAIFLSLAICGSKTVMALAAGIMITSVLFDARISAVRRRRILAFLVTATGCIASFLVFTPAGQQVAKDIVIIDRFIAISEDRSALGYTSPVASRIELWSMGMQRVALSPVMGIRLSGEIDEDNPVNYCCPHNEFIASWTFLGGAGLMAYVFLIGGLIVMNIPNPNRLFWLQCYFALIVQMFFDAAFQTTRFIPFFFIFAGLNMRELRRRGVNTYVLR